MYSWSWRGCTQSPQNMIQKIKPWISVSMEQIKRAACTHIGVCGVAEARIGPRPLPTMGPTPRCLTPETSAPVVPNGPKRNVPGYVCGVHNSALQHTATWCQTYTHTQTYPYEYKTHTNMRASQVGGGMRMNCPPIIHGWGLAPPII